MKVQMTAQFQILRAMPDGSWEPQSNNELSWMSVGGFCFVVDGKKVRFDWDAEATTQVQTGVYEYESGYGPFFNDHEISADVDEDLNAVGLSRSDLSAKFLASATEIEEFHISLDDRLSYDDISIGMCEDNANAGAAFHVRLLSVTFTDDIHDDGEEPFMVPQSVIDCYNRGQAGMI